MAPAPTWGRVRRPLGSVRIEEISSNDAYSMVGEKVGQVAMSIMHRLDPEFARVVARSPNIDLTDLAAARSAVGALMAQQRSKVGGASAVSQTDYRSPGRRGNPDVLVRLFRPPDPKAQLPCVFWIQGGGHVLPSPDLDDAWCENIVEEIGCVVVSVAWRRAPEHPFPAAAEDCYTGLSWLANRATELGVDPARVAIAGKSSGGGYAASLALMVRDRGEFSIRHQLLIHPMLDDRNTTRSSYRVTDSQVWNRTANQIAWQAYLGSAYGTDDVSPYAAASRMADLSGVAATTMLTNELDLFVDEDIDYAMRLIDADVPTELHVYPGAPHGFDRLAPYALVTKRFIADRNAALRRAFGSS